MSPASASTEFSGYVEHGTIGDHVESSLVKKILADLFYRELNTHIQYCPL